MPRCSFLSMWISLSAACAAGLALVTPVEAGSWIDQLARLLSDPERLAARAAAFANTMIGSASLPTSLGAMPRSCEATKDDTRASISEPSTALTAS